MRSSGCTIQQTLTLESAAVVNQAVTLARRRGHGQVTPLHVANAMLSSSSSAGLLRQACLQSHTHPLQCRALELCFNVALNRLPAPSTSSSPMLSGPHLHPSISNSLLAAFKRAQAHQRRGSIENQHQQQQQTIMAVKIEVEQLIISILDDPSVSRVMREAGFSSTMVKDKVEQAISMKVMRSNNTKNVDRDPGEIKEPCSSENLSDRGRTDDVSSVIEGLLVSGKRKRCCVVVGECIATLEGAIRGADDRVKKGDDHSFGEALREVRFESLPLDSFGALSRDKTELKIAQITRLVECYGRKGLVLYLGDLRWVIELRKEGGGEIVEYFIKELRRLVLECNSQFVRLWLVGAATFQTYTSFEANWGFHAITIPAGSLGLSLTPQSDYLASKTTNDTMSWLVIKDDDNNNMCNSEPTTPSLPSWLQKCKDENKGLNNKSTKEDSVPVKDLCKSWSFSETTLSFFSVSPPSSSEFSYERQQCFNPRQTRHPAVEVEPFQTTLSMYVASSISSSVDVNVKEMECTQKRFNDYNSLSLETLCYALESKVPWQKEIVRDVASTILDCRSRKLRRREDTWFFFLGDDVNGKEKIGRELARHVFGSENKYISIGLSSFSSKEDSGKKRSRDEHSFTFSDRLMEAISVDPHRVLFVEEIEQMGYLCQDDIKRVIERGVIRSSCNGKEVSLEDAIIILSCERFTSRSRACSPSTKQIVDNHHYQGRPREEEKVGCCSHESNGNHITSRRVSLDLNISITDDYAFDDQIHKDGSYVDELGLVGYVDKCILFKL